MTTLQLEYFKALTKMLNVSKVAEMFFVSPPAITAAIDRLESELDTELFTIHGRSLALTPAGEIFSAAADDMLASLSRAKENISHLRKSSLPPISVGITSPITWAALFDAFMLENPDIKLSSILLKEHQLNDPEIYGKLDFVFCSPELFNSSLFEFSPLPVDCSPCLAVYHSHPLADRKSIRLSEVRNERFIALSAGYSYRSYFDKLCAMAGFTPNIVLECDFSMRAAMLSAGYGILVTTKSVAQSGALGNAVFIDIVDPFYSQPHSLHAIKGYSKNPAANRFYEYIMEYFSLDPKSGEAAAK